MWDVVGLTIIVGFVGLFAFTFINKDENHIVYRVFHKGFIAFLVIGGIVFVLATCVQSMGRNSDSIYERDYRR